VSRVEGCNIPPTYAEEEKMSQGKFPPGWDEDRVRRVLEHYEEQSEEEAVAGDEAAFEDQKAAVVEVPHEMLPSSGSLLQSIKHSGQITQRLACLPVTITRWPPGKRVYAK
jgi:hypothetical protein